MVVAIDYESDTDSGTSDGAGKTSTMSVSTTSVPYMTPKLQQRLERLNDTPSKESLQTIARWCAFHRRPPKSNQICDGILKSIITNKNDATSLKRGILYLYALNELLMCDAPVTEGSSTGEPPENNSSNRIFAQLKMWESLTQLRGLVGDAVIVPALEHIAKLMKTQNLDGDVIEKHKDNILHMIDGWESANAFDSPSLTEQLRKVVHQVEVPTTTINDETTSTTVEGSAPVAETAKIYESSTEQTTDVEKSDKEIEDKPSMNNDASENNAIKSDTQTKAEAKEVVKKENPEPSSMIVATEIAPKAEDDEQVVTKDPSLQSPEPTQTEERSKDPLNVQEPLPTVLPTTKKPSAMAKDKRLSSEGSTMIFEKVDFEKEGIPQKKVTIDQILNPFQSIATTQIARDLRHDFVERLFTSLNSVPTSVIEYAKKEKEENSTKKEDNEEKMDDASSSGERDDGLSGGPPLTDYPEDFLDINMNDAMNKVEQYRNAVLKQKKARSTCVNLLLASHCQFGSKDAAESFEDILNKLETLKETKLILRDAMELEGIDMEENDESADQDVKVEPLDWYKKENADGIQEKESSPSPSAKRQKIEQ